MQELSGSQPKRYVVELAVDSILLSGLDMMPEVNVEVKLWAMDGTQAGQLAIQVARSLSTGGVHHYVHSINTYKGD